MRLILVFLFAVLSSGVQAESTITRESTQITTPAKPRSHLPVSRTKKILVKATNPNDLDDNDEGGSDELDVYVGYRRPEVVDKLVHDNDDVSDYVKTRLLIARVRALKKFAETQTDLV